MRVRARLAALAAGGVAMTAAIAGAVPAAQAATGPAFPQYTLTISPPGQSYLKINSHGDILGEGHPTPDVLAGFVLPAGSSTPQWLSVAGLSNTNAQEGAASLNDLDQAVGTNSNNPARPLFWPAGNTTGTDLGIHPGAGTTANWINNNGQIVGASYTNFQPSPWLSQHGQLTNLPTISGHATPNAINDNGLIVGADGTPTGNQVAVSWQNGKITPLGLLPGGGTSEADVVNQNGIAAGVATVNFVTYPVIFDHGTVTTINVDGVGGYPPTAAAINDGGAVVGLDGNVAAYAYQNGVVREISSLFPAGSNVFPETATGINDAGVIVGQGILSTPQGQVGVGYKLTPVHSGS